MREALAVAESRLSAVNNNGDANDNDACNSSGDDNHNDNDSRFATAHSASASDDDEDEEEANGEEGEEAPEGGEAMVGADSDDDGWVDDSDDDAFYDDDIDAAEEGEEEGSTVAGRAAAEVEAAVLATVADAALHPFYSRLAPSFKRLKPPHLNGGDGFVFKPLAFIGLIVTKCAEAEDGTAIDVTTNLLEAPRRARAHATYAAQRRELFVLLNSLPQGLRLLANRIGAYALSIHESYDDRPSITGLLLQTRRLLEDSRTMAHTLAPQRSPFDPPMVGEGGEEEEDEDEDADEEDGHFEEMAVDESPEDSGADADDTMES